MHETGRRTSRRTYLKRLGAVTAVASTAGCVGGLGGGGSGSMTIVPGTAPGFPPFETKQGGEIVGFDIDLLSAVVSNTDYELESWKDFEFSSLTPALKNDKIDVIAAAMTINEKRDESIDFTNPYYSADQAVLVRKGASSPPSEFAGLAGRTVGVQEGTTGASVVEKQLVKPGKIAQSKFNTYGNYVLAVEDLVNRNLDAVVLDTPVARTFVDRRAVTIAATYETGEKYGFGVRTDADDLTKALNDGLKQVRNGSKYEEIRDEWFAGGGSGGNASAGNGTGGNASVGATSNGSTTSSS
ncbi:transporter substrate-binding domain-containing protein [Halococcus thailandensis]|uniref:Amino acid ABC transporter amino acid-binding protein n=1 Tax=Halococcus thailandensis JCM 13552 TaxID=1227457 RepID=M0N421_9EURY|nr:transporter substrate-binding domain-containing protein [Halococcus thailandensis]EMA52293.1 amino acid ABC transporter amino acid-binding protein [Halococcus thailandensis JCM 13552]